MTFPVLWQGDRKYLAELKRLGCPRTVPLALVQPHEHQALRNHDQTLARLAERGGLGPAELVAVLGDRRWHQMSVEDEVRELLALTEPANGRAP